MSNMFEQAQKEIGSYITKARWGLGLNGALYVAFAITIIIWPNISLYSLVIVFGAFALARGVVGLIAAISAPIPSGRGWLILSSLAGIAVGVLVFTNTGMSARALLYVIGAYAVALGIVTVGGAFWLPLDGGDRLLLAVTGLVSILFGVVMFAEPETGALALLALIAAFALIVGVAELTVAIGGERLFKRSLQRFEAMAAKPRPSH
jgi:uncharacterized membrane protein HdeD (DUF308 family)